MHAWFPEGGSTPSAFLVDTSEEALLLPDWLCLRMLRSSNRHLVQFALQVSHLPLRSGHLDCNAVTLFQDIDPHQLIIFVQSFGIPPANMSLLWREVDKFTQQDSSAVEQVSDVLDRWR